VSSCCSGDPAPPGPPLYEGCTRGHRRGAEGSLPGLLQCARRPSWQTCRRTSSGVLPIRSRAGPIDLRSLAPTGSIWGSRCLPVPEGVGNDTRRSGCADV